MVKREIENFTKGCEYKDRSQKPCQIMVKTENFFTYVFFLTFESYVIHSKLGEMTNMNIEEFKLKHYYKMRSNSLWVSLDFE
jgi:hypothetical protein